MKKIILLGAGGHAKACIDVIKSEKKYEIYGIINKKIEKKLDNFFDEYKILGDDSVLKNISKITNNVHLAIGMITNFNLRINIYKKILSNDLKVTKIISPLSYISSTSYVGDGTSVMHHAIINSNSKIGINSIINSKSLIEHDVIIGNNTHISTGAIVNGGVSIGDNVFIGSGSIIYNNIKISSNNIIPAGSIIKNNI